MKSSIKLSQATETRGVFFSKLTEELLSNSYNRWPDNYDPARWGRGSRRSTMFGWVRSWLNKFGVFITDRSCFEDQANVRQLSDHWEGFETLYHSLKDEPSRRLLLKLLALRILGHERVKLPRNDANYWPNRKKAASSMRVGTECIPLRELGWELRLYDLSSLGFPLRVLLTELGLSCTFQAQQYLYDRPPVRCGVEAGDVVIDAGGCWGDTALYFAHLCGDRGKVYSFEFIPSNIVYFEKNLALNPSLSGRIEIVSRPVWDRSGETLYFWDNESGSRVSPEPTAQCTEKVLTINIDDLVEEKGLRAVNFIKMDIEGAEQNALLGAVRTLKRFRPKLAISIYHRLKDYHEIPAFIDSLDLDYDFHLDHSTIYGEETILFALPR